MYVPGSDVIKLSRLTLHLVDMLFHGRRMVVFQMRYCFN